MVRGYGADLRYRFSHSPVHIPYWFRPGWVYHTTDKEPEQSDSIEGLAQKLGLDPAKLKKTVDEYNAAINDKEFDLM